ncbi:MAG: cytochrome c biogenesis protein [Planctomycetota bacterium]
MNRFVSLSMFLALFLLLAPTTASAQEDSRHEPWSDEIVELFSTLPVQDGGRVKPMHSIAGLHLLTFNGKRTLKLDDDSKLDQDRWLLDVFFFPEQADNYPSFRVQDDAVLHAVGLKSKKKRAWYSYNELVPARAKIDAEAQKAFDVEAAKRNALERNFLKLSQDLRSYESLRSMLAMSRLDFPTNGHPALTAVLGPKQPGYAWTLPYARDLQLFGGVHGTESAEYAALNTLLSTFDIAGEAGFRALTLFPPSEPDHTDHTGHTHEADPAWWSPFNVMYQAFRGQGLDVAPQVQMSVLFERLESQKNDQTAFTATLQELHGLVVAAAEARGEYGHIPLEVRMYHLDPFFKSQILYLFAFLLAIIGFLATKQKWLHYGTWGFIIGAVGLATVGIVMRCIIRDRPPVVSLYDTILFITCVTVYACMFMEWITRQRIALFLAAFLGAAGMFLAGRYELKEVASAGDTMASVVAVLDTNYYLAIHVTTVTMGYAGGLLAAAIAHVWIFAKLFGFRRDDKEFYKGISRMTYGTVCFSLLFSLFGTIMGGVWANDSWGRFWGWDPKENGALLICIWMLVVLHARLGGYIRDRGLANLAVIGGAVVSASWWGVNLLNVGLHSYGFTSGVAMALYIYWGIEVIVLLISGIDALVSRRGSGTPPAPAVD